MALKVCFKNQIHRISKPPAALDALISYALSVFKGQLPEKWVLQYVDSDGDYIMLTDENDFKCLKEELDSSNRSIKVHVVPLQDLGCSATKPKVDESVEIKKCHEAEEQKEIMPVTAESQQLEKENAQEKGQTLPEETSTPKVEPAQLSKVVAVSENKDSVQVEEKQQVDHKVSEKEGESNEHELQKNASNLQNSCDSLFKPTQSQQKTYSKEVMRKAEMLKSVFEEASLDNLLEFVSQVPNYRAEQLVESYLTQVDVRYNY